LHEVTALTEYLHTLLFAIVCVYPKLFYAATWLMLTTYAILLCHPQL